MIGDTERDVLAATSAGVKAFMVPANTDWADTADLILAG
jgi:phosphoglycolate phosphatase-like HAD superfamily hydrolase